MVEKAQVQRTLDELLKRLNGAQLGDRDWPEERVLVCAIRDLRVYFRGTFAAGKVSRLVEHPDAEGADVIISVSSDDLIALSDGRLSPVFAFLSGKLRVDADARDMMLLRQLF